MPDTDRPCSVNCDWPRKAEYILAALQDRKEQQDRIENTLEQMWKFLDALKTQIVASNSTAAKDRSDLWKADAVGETKLNGIIALVTFASSISGGLVVMLAQYFLKAGS